MPKCTAVSHKNVSFKLFVSRSRVRYYNFMTANVIIDSTNFFSVIKIVGNIIKMDCFVNDKKLYLVEANATYGVTLLEMSSNKQCSDQHNLKQ